MQRQQGATLCQISAVRQLLARKTMRQLRVLSLFGDHTMQVPLVWRALLSLAGTLLLGSVPRSTLDFWTAALIRVG